MKKSKTIKLLASLFIIVFINIVVKGLFVTKYPNSLSIEEINLLGFSRIPLTTNINYYSFRIFPVLASTLISCTSFLMFYKISKSLLLGYCVGISLIISPWIWLLSRFLNFYIFFLVAIVCIPYFFGLNKTTYWVGISFLTVLRYIIGSDSFIMPTDIVYRFVALLKLFDFRNLFFTGDYTSIYLRIPRTGFFMYIEIAIFFAGLYYLFFNTNNKIKSYILYFMILGIFWFLTAQDNLILTYKGLLIFYPLSLIIAFGYYFLFKLLSINKKAFIPISLIYLIVFINFLYYQELFYFHFSKRNSFEWGYAEEKLCKYINNEGKIYKNLIISSSASKITNYLPLFVRNIDSFRLHQIPSKKLTTIKQKCLEKDTLCILKEDDLQILDIEKEQVKDKVNYFNGLTAYFLLSKNTLLSK